jgi:hypothetical protein
MILPPVAEAGGRRPRPDARRGADAAAAAAARVPAEALLAGRRGGLHPIRPVQVLGPAARPPGGKFVQFREWSSQ